MAKERWSDFQDLDCCLRFLEGKSMTLLFSLYRVCIRRLYVILTVTSCHPDPLLVWVEPQIFFPFEAYTITCIYNLTWKCNPIATFVNLHAIVDRYSFREFSGSRLSMYTSLFACPRCFSLHLKDFNLPDPSLASLIPLE